MDMSLGRGMSIASGAGVGVWWVLAGATGIHIAEALITAIILAVISTAVGNALDPH